MAYVRFHLFVTGKGERDFAGRLLGGITAGYTATFLPPEFVGQWRPRAEHLAQLKVTGTVKNLPTKLEEKVSLPTNAKLRNDPHCFVVFVDDLEAASAPIAGELFAYYRSALDKALPTKALRDRASVHFLVNMLEAYYFAHPEAVNSVLGTALNEPDRDVEEITHPKNDMKKLTPGFDERAHGAQIVDRLDLDVVLKHPARCRSLRTLVGWCVHRLGVPFSERWRLADGEFHPLTRAQIPWPKPVAT